MYSRNTVYLWNLKEKTMTLKEQKSAAKAFAESWKGRGDEKQD